MAILDDAIGKQIAAGNHVVVFPYSHERSKRWTSSIPKCHKRIRINEMRGSSGRFADHSRQCTAKYSANDKTIPTRSYVMSRAHQASYCGFGWSSTAMSKLTVVPLTLVTVTVKP